MSTLLTNPLISGPERPDRVGVPEGDPEAAVADRVPGAVGLATVTLCTGPVWHAWIPRLFAHRIRERRDGH